MVLRFPLEQMHTLMYDTGICNPGFRIIGLSVVGMESHANP
jgi:hypothetical protein